MTSGYQQRPPDGGYGWIITLVVMLNFFNAGLIFASFGVLYLEFVDVFQMSVAGIGLLITIESFVVHLSGAIIPGLFSKADPRIVCSLSAATTAAGYFVAGYSNTFTTLAVGFALTGLGNGTQYVINSAILQTYFDKKRILATGLTTVGMSISNLIIPPLTRYLINVYTWRGALILLSGCLMQSMWLSLLLRPLDQPMKHKEDFTSASAINNQNATRSRSKLKNLCSGFASRLNCHVLLNGKFFVFGIATLLFFTCYNMFYLHMINKGIDCGLSDYEAALIPAVSGFVNLICRPTFGFIYALCSVSRVLLVGLSTVLFGVFIAVFGIVQHLSLFLIVSGLAGTAVASQVISYHPALVDILGVENILGGVSWLGLFLGVGQMIGTPLAGWIYDVSLNYNIPFYVAGIIGAAGGLCYLSLLCFKPADVEKSSESYNICEQDTARKKLQGELVKSSIIDSTLSLSRI